MTLAPRDYPPVVNLNQSKTRDDLPVHSGNFYGAMCTFTEDFIEEGEFCLITNHVSFATISRVTIELKVLKALPSRGNTGG